MFLFFKLFMFGIVVLVVVNVGDMVRYVLWIYIMKFLDFLLCNFFVFLFVWGLKNSLCDKFIRMFFFFFLYGKLRNCWLISMCKWFLCVYVGDFCVYVFVRIIFINMCDWFWCVIFWFVCRCYLYMYV